MNYNSDIPIATDGNQLPRRLLSIKMAVFMNGICKKYLQLYYDAVTKSDQILEKY
jgi:hypothetical protein